MTFNNQCFLLLSKQDTTFWCNANYPSIHPIYNWGVCRCQHWLFNQLNQSVFVFDYIIKMENCTRLMLI